MRAAELCLQSTVWDQLHLGSLFSEKVSLSGAREMLFRSSIVSHHPPVMRQSPRIMVAVKVEGMESALAACCKSN